MRRLKSESGQVLVLTAVSMTLLLGFMGMAVDVGQLFHQKRSMQIDADDAAIAGAMAYMYDTRGGGSAVSSHITAAATQALADNGLTGVTVTTSATGNVTSPTLYVTPGGPTDGPNTGRAGFVEAVLTVPQGTVFMSLFGFGSMNVSTRAVAGPGATSKGCIYILNNQGADSLYFGGKFTVDAPGCGIIVNSSDGCALDFNGGGQGKSSTLNSGWVAVDGGDCGQSGDSNPTPVTNTGVQVSDPNAGLVTIPDNSVCDSSNTDPISTISSSTAGTYVPHTSSGAAIAGPIVCFSNTVKISGPAPPGTPSDTTNPCGTGNYYNLGSGTQSTIYVLEGGIDFKGGCVGSAADGVTMDLTGYCTSGNCNGNSLSVNTLTYFDLYSPLPSMSVSCTSGCTPNSNYGNGGILFEQAGSNTGTLAINNGNSSGAMTGEIYAPDSTLLVKDNGSSGNTNLSFSITSDIIVGSLNDQASSFTVNDQNNTPYSTMTHVTLVE